MKCILLHESNKKIRIRLPQLNMSLQQADIIEYYLRDLPGVKDAVVYERTGDAVITFTAGAAEGKGEVFRAMESFSYDDEHTLSLVPETTGRELNRMYEEKLIGTVCGRVFRRLFFPAPLAAAWTVCSSIPFIFKGIRSLGSGRLRVPLLDSIAIGASIARGDFDTAGSIMFLLNIGDTLEEWTRKKSVGDLARSMALDVDKVWMKTEGGEEVLCDVNDMRIGDRFILRSSEIIPLDGKVLDGMMTVNQSTMTGEAEPVEKSAGSFVFAGTVVNEGECIVEVTKTSGTGKYDQIVKMIEDSEKLKSSTEARAYRLADGLVPYSLAGAAITYLLTRNVTKALSFLMVDYSCAMKLSMPLSVLNAIREARDYDIAIKGGKFIEAAAEAETIVFDKTGTLTHANPRLVDVIPFEGRDADEMLRIAACLEEHYPHSVANAIVNGAVERGLVHEEIHSKVEYIVAHGVASSIGSDRVLIGSRHFVIEDEGCVMPDDAEEIIAGISPEYSRLYLAIDGRLAAVMCISDPLRAEAASVIKELHTLGISKVCMMTGDNRVNAKAVAEKLRLDEFHAEVLPEDKAAFIRAEHEAGRKVIMIGDGVNDTPALSEADVGIAISDGAAIAREVADITITADNLYRLVILRKLSMRLMDRIRGNYRFIIEFNSALILLGLFGILPPSSSALLHNGSTIIAGLKSTTNLLESGADKY